MKRDRRSTYVIKTSFPHPVRDRHYNLYVSKVEAYTDFEESRLKSVLRLVRNIEKAFKIVGHKRALRIAKLCMLIDSPNKYTVEKLV